MCKNTHKTIDNNKLVCKNTHIQTTTGKGMKSRDVMDKLMADGWQLIRVKGSHHQLKKPGNPNLITISHPVKDMTIGQIRDAEKKSGLKF